MKLRRYSEKEIEQLHNLYGQIIEELNTYDKNASKIGSSIAQIQRVLELADEDLAHCLEVTNHTLLAWKEGKVLPRYSEYKRIGALIAMVALGVNELVIPNEEPTPSGVGFSSFLDYIRHTHRGH